MNNMENNLSQGNDSFLSTNISVVPKKNLTLDIDQLRAYTDLLDGGNQVYRAFYDKKESRQVFYPEGEVDDVKDELIKLIKRGYGIFTVVNGKNYKKVSKGVTLADEDITKIRSHFVDLDEAPLQPVLDSGFKPHLIVQSSNTVEKGQRFQVYWKVSDCPVDRYEEIQKKIAKRFNGDSTVCNPSRIMRTPGTPHQKYDPCRCEILEINPQLPIYTLQQIIDGLRLEVEPAKTRIIPQRSRIQKNKQTDESEHRNDTLCQAAGRLEDKNCTYDEILAGLQAENCLFQEPVDTRKISEVMAWIWGKREERLKQLNTLVDELKNLEAGTPRVEVIQNDEAENVLRLAQDTDPVLWSNIEDLFKPKGKIKYLNKAVKRPALALASNGNAPGESTLSLSRESFAPNAWADDIMAKSKLIYDDEFFEFNGRYFESKKDTSIKYEIRAATEWGADIRHTSEIMEAMRIKLSRGVPERNPKGLLCLKNGIFNFGTGETFEHSDQFFFTHMVAVDYNKEATCPTWNQTLLEILPDSDSRLLLQKYAGYSLTSGVHHQVSLFMYGPGGNGKSTILDTIRNLLGTKNCGVLSLKNLGSHFMLHKVRGLLANFTNEIDSAFVSSDGPFKEIVDGSPIAADIKYKDPITFEPFCKLWIASNSILSSKDTSDGFLRRFLFLDFPVCFTNSKKRIKKRAEYIIENELSGVLNWAIEGLRLLNQDGFEPLPECHYKLRQVTKSKIHPRSDFFSLYLMESYGSFVKLQDVVQSYNNYAKDMGRIPVSDATIREEIETYFKSSGVYYTRRNVGMGFVNLSFVQPEDIYDLEGVGGVKYDGADLSSAPCQNDIPF